MRDLFISGWGATTPSWLLSTISCPVSVLTSGSVAFGRIVGGMASPESANC